MKISAYIQKHDQTKMFDVIYYPDPNRWEVCRDLTSQFMSEEGWSNYIKYLDDNGEISQEIRQVTRKHGGIYVFFIQGDTLPFCERYLAYIGRAQLTEKQSIGKRLCEYLRESQKESSRPLIPRLFHYWKDKLYVRYYLSDDNSQIVNGESALIKSILPPFNDDMPDTVVLKEPQKAF